MNLKYTETKRHLNKPDQAFICDLLHYEKNHVVLKYFSEAPGQIADIKIPPGSTTIAWYWANREYVLWQLFDQDKTLIGTLFHICTDIKITKTGVSYLDLILDIWISPDNTARVLDQDELEDIKSKGLLSKHHLSQIEDTKRLIMISYPPIIDAACNRQHL